MRVLPKGRGSRGDRNGATALECGVIGSAAVAVPFRTFYAALSGVFAGIVAAV
jgi:hypothetical protein